jgi:hypothetical protein
MRATALCVYLPGINKTLLLLLGWSNLGKCSEKVVFYLLVNYREESNNICEFWWYLLLIEAGCVCNLMRLAMGKKLGHFWAAHWKQFGCNEIRERWMGIEWIIKGIRRVTKKLDLKQ